MKVRSKAPLRLGLAGGGTDLSPYCDTYGGVVLNVTINLYAHCTIEVIEEPQVVFKATDLGEEFVGMATSKLEIDDKLKLHKGVYNRIVQDYNNGNPLYVKVTTYADAPPGSGLGTSSTMVVALLKAYIELLQLPLGEYDVAILAYQIERIDLQLAGGKQDQYAATFGGFNFIEFYKDNRVIVNPLRIRNWFIDELEDSLVLFFTGKSRESAKIITEQIKSTTENKKDNLEAMHELKKSAYLMKEALLKGNVKAMAEELAKSFEAKKRTSSVISNPMIEKIYEAAVAAGAIAGKISGAGGGGFMMFIVEPTKKLQVVEALEKFSGKVVNTCFVDKGTKGWYV